MPWLDNLIFFILKYILCGWSTVGFFVCLGFCIFLVFVFNAVVWLLRYRAWHSWRSLLSLSWLCRSLNWRQECVMSSVVRVENRVYCSFKSGIYNPFLWLCARRKTLLSVFIGFEIDCFPLSAQYFHWLLWLAVLLMNTQAILMLEM